MYDDINNNEQENTNHYDTGSTYTHYDSSEAMDQRTALVKSVLQSVHLPHRVGYQTGIALHVRYHGAGRCSRSVPCWQMHGIPKHGCKQAGLHPENAPVYGGRTYDLLPASAMPATVPDRSGASRSD